LEVSGFIFLCFTAIIVTAFVRECGKFAKHQVGVERVILTGAIGAMFLYFGVSSFWRARRKRS
jgi:type VI protein secretion system component VasK